MEKKSTVDWSSAGRGAPFKKAARQALPARIFLIQESVRIFNVRDIIPVECTAKFLFF